MSEPPLYQPLKRVFSLLVRAFFREVEISGVAHIPVDRGGIVVSWHPNGMIDPGLILTSFPRRVSFGARHGLFNVPVLGWAMRAVGTVPIRRVIDLPGADPAARREANKKSLDALANVIASGDFAALFPEGVSHDQPGLVELKTGVARLYYQARAATPAGRPPPVIVPVGLHYDRKSRFRSRAYVAFHPPIALPAALDPPAADEPEEDARKRVEALTDLVESVLREAIGATDDWATYAVLHHARALLRAERLARSSLQKDGGAPEPATMAEEAAGFARVRAAYLEWNAREPKRIGALRFDVERYAEDLRALDLTDGDLDRDPDLLSPWLAFFLVLQALFVFFLLPPFLVIGFVVNAPVALLTRFIARVGASWKKDEASLKLFAGIALYPLAWIGAGILGWWLHERLDDLYALPDRPILAGFVVALISAIGGAAMLRFTRLARETARALRVRLTRRARVTTLARLKAERARLHDEIRALA